MAEQDHLDPIDEELDPPAEDGAQDDGEDAAPAAEKPDPMSKMADSLVGLIDKKIQSVVVRQPELQIVPEPDVEVEFDGDEVDEKVSAPVKAAVKKLSQRYNSEIAALKNEMQGLRRMQHASLDSALDNQVKTVVREIDAEYPGLLSKDDIKQIKIHASVVAKGYSAAPGVDVPDDDSIIRSAFHAVMGGKIRQLEKTKLKNQLQKRERQIGIPPTQRKTDEPLGEDAARDWAEDFVQTKRASMPTPRKRTKAG